MAKQADLPLGHDDALEFLQRRDMALRIREAEADKREDLSGAANLQKLRAWRKAHGLCRCGLALVPGEAFKNCPRCRERHRLNQRRRNRNLTDAERAERNARSNRSYHRMKDAPKRPAQGELPLDHVPRIVAAHGLRAAHPKPLVSLGKVPGRAFASHRVSPAQAWHFPEIELARAGSSIAALVLDCDQPESDGPGHGRLAPAKLDGLANGEQPLPSRLGARNTRPPISSSAPEAPAAPCPDRRLLQSGPWGGRQL